MSAYDDLIPGTSPSRRRSAYDDLLPGGAPAAAVGTAEEAALVGDAPAPLPGIVSEVSRINEEMAASQPARATMTRRGAVQMAPADLALKEPEQRVADWSDVGKSIAPMAGTSLRNAFNNLRRMGNEENIQNRQMVLDSTPVGGPALPMMVRRGLERQQSKLDEEVAARPEIVSDAAASMQDLAEGTPKDMSTLQKGVFSAGTSAPTTLLALAFAKNPALAMALGGAGGSAVQAGSTYGEATEKGADHRMASVAASIDGMIEGLDALPIGVALKPGSAFMKRIAATMATESLTEGGQQALQDFRAMAMENPELTLGEVALNFKVAMVAGGLGGAVYGSVGAAANAGKKQPAPMHSEPEPAVQAEPVEPAVVQPPAPAEKPRSPYADLVPELDKVLAESERLSKKAREIADGTIGGATDEQVLEAIAESRRNAPPVAPEAPVAANEPEPWQADTPAREPLTIEHPEIRTQLEDMAKNEAGWAEVGGRMIRQKHSEVAGDETITRSQWIPKADWWKGRPGGLNEAQTQEAVRKAIAGEKLNAREQRAVDYMVEVSNERLAERSAIADDEWSSIGKDLKGEDLEPSHQNTVAADLVAKAVAVNEAAVEDAARKYENDDAAFMAEIKRIANGEEVQNDEAAGRRKANLGSPQEAKARGGLQLEQQTEADLAARARALAEAEAKRIAAEKTAEAKRKADAERDDFSLTGSERAADANPGQGGLFGMPAGTATIPAQAVSATPPKAKQQAVGKEQARPDAIRVAMRQLFGAPLSEKGLSKKYLGIYKIKPQTIRLKNRNDLRTASHEIGHHISNLNRPFRKVMRAHQAELVKIAPRPYLVQAVNKFGSLPAALADGETRRHLIEEGFAEFIAEYLTNPTQLQAKTPSFYKEFETWLGQNADYSKALGQVQEMLFQHRTLPAADKILSKVGAFTPTLGQRVGALVSKDAWDTFAQATLDKWHPLKAMVADLNPALATSKNPYAAARLLAGDAAIIEDWISDFTTPFDYTKRLDGKNYGKPLKAILEPVLKGGQGEIDGFKAYMIARRAAELKKVGKENLFSDEEIRDGLTLETPLFKQVAAEVYEYNDRLLDYAVEGGLLAQETADKFKQYANYIPFFREPDSQAKGDGRGNPFKRLTGGTANLRDPIANLIQNTANIIHATNRNAMVQKAADLAAAVPGGGRWLEAVKVPQEAHALATKRIIEELERQGVKVDTSMAQGMADMQTFFTPSGKGDERTKTIVYKAAGELKAVQVNDPVLWKALGNLPPLQMGLVMKILAFPAQTLRAGVVLDPTFMVRNFVRDTLSATVQSKGAFIPVASTAQGIKMMAQQKDAYRLWRAFGGAFGDQFREPEESARVIERMAKRGGFSPASIISPVRLLDALKKVGSFSESGSRIGEFAATYKPGSVESALEAALNSREVSTDFGMRGGSEAIQVLTRITPFMNPAMQGLYKTARVLTGADSKAAAAKAAILGVNMALVSIALALMNSDQDWYKRIEEWEKVTYWHFKVGDNVYRIPKPFEYGTLFASMPEAIALRAAGKEGNEDFKKRMLQALGQVFGFRVIPQAATLLAEPWANKSFFTGRKIVPDKQQHLEPRLQSNPMTSKSAQAAGELANVSPAVIDNVIRNVFGTIGVHATTVADLLLEKAGTFPVGREKTWQSWPVIKAFVRDPENPNSKQQRDFYEALEKYRTAVATVRELQNRGEDTKAEAYSIDKQDELASAKSAEAASKRLAKIRKAISKIDWDRDMTAREKREATSVLNEQMQDIAEEQTPLYQAAKKSYIRPATEGGR